MIIETAKIEKNSDSNFCTVDRICIIPDAGIERYTSAYHGSLGLISVNALNILHAILCYSNMSNMVIKLVRLVLYGFSII